MNYRNDELLEAETADYKMRLMVTGVVILILVLVGLAWYLVWTLLSVIQSIGQL